MSHHVYLRAPATAVATLTGVTCLNSPHSPGFQKLTSGCCHVLHVDQSADDDSGILTLGSKLCDHLLGKKITTTVKF